MLSNPELDCWQYSRQWIDVMEGVVYMAINYKDLEKSTWHRIRSIMLGSMFEFE